MEHQIISSCGELMAEVTSGRSIAGCRSGGGGSGPVELRGPTDRPRRHRCLRAGRSGWSGRKARRRAGIRPRPGGGQRSGSASREPRSRDSWAMSPSGASSPVTPVGNRLRHPAVPVGHDRQAGQRRLDEHHAKALRVTVGRAPGRSTEHRMFVEQAGNRGRGLQSDEVGVEGQAIGHRRRSARSGPYPDDRHPHRAQRLRQHRHRRQQVGDALLLHEASDEDDAGPARPRGRRAAAPGSRAVDGDLVRAVRRAPPVGPSGTPMAR